MDGDAVEMSNTDVINMEDAAKVGPVPDTVPEFELPPAEPMPKAKSEKKAPKAPAGISASALKDIRRSLAVLEKRGMTREDVIVLVADGMNMSWGGRAQQWNGRKKIVQEVLFALDSVAGRKP